MSNDHHTIKVMQGHYKWMVLVTIVWTILLICSANESIIKVPKDLNSSEKFEENLRKSYNATAIVRSISRKHSQTNDNMFSSISEDVINENAKSDHYSTNQTSFFHLSRRTSGLVSLMKNLTLSSDTNEIANSSRKPVSNFTKVVALNATIEVSDSTKSEHQRFSITDRVPNISGISDHSALLIANSNSSRRESSTEYTRDDRKLMDSSRDNDAKEENKLIDGVTRSSFINGNYVTERLPISDMNKKSFKLAFAKHAKENDRKKRLPSYKRSWSRETSKILESKDEINVIARSGPKAVTNIEDMSSHLSRSTKIKDVNQFKAIDRFFKNSKKKLPAKRRMQANDPAHRMSGFPITKINSAKVVARRRVDKGIFWKSRSGKKKSNEGFELSDLNKEKKRFESYEKFVDNVANRDGKSGNRIHRSIVNVGLTGIQTNRQPHKCVIAQDCTRGNNLRQNEKQEDVQKHKEKNRKLLLKMDEEVIGGSSGSENKALGSITLENSNAFNSVTMMQPSSSISNPVGRIEVTRRKIDDDVISSKGTTEITSILFPDIAEKKNFANRITKIDWHSAIDTPLSIGIPISEQHPRDYVPDDIAEYGCSEDAVTTDIVHLKGPQPQYDNTLTSDNENDNGAKILLDSQSNIVNKDSDTFVVSGQSAASISSVVSDEKARNMRNDKGGVQLTAANRSAAILAKDQQGIEDATSVRHSSGLVDNQTDKSLKNTTIMIPVSKLRDFRTLRTNGFNEEAVFSNDRNRKESIDDVAKKIDTGSKIRAKNMNETEIDPVFDVGSSLEHASVKFKVIDYSRSEARVGKRLNHEESRMLVRGQEPTSISSERKNLIFSHLRGNVPLITDKLNITDDYVTSELIVDQRNKNRIQNNFDTGNKGDFYSEKQKNVQKPSIIPVIETFPEKTWKNISMYSTAQAESASSRDRRRKSLDHDEITVKSTSSTKTDSNSIRPIGRTFDDDRYSMREELLQVSPPSRISSLSSVYSKIGDAVVTEQIKRGFTEEDSITISVTEPTGYTNIDTTMSSMISDINSTKNTEGESNVSQSKSDISNFDIVKSDRISNNERQKNLPNQIDDVSIQHFTVPITNENQTFEYQFEPEKASNLSINQLLNFEQDQIGQPLENNRNHLGSVESLNHMDRDNSTRVTATLNQWPVKHSAVVEGDLLLGGLMMVHEREDSITCGPVMPQGGVQALEAMLYTLDWLNKQDLVPGVKIGAHILDDCDKDTYGLEMAVDFIKGSISNIDGAEYHCNKTAVRKVISGVVGAASSVTSIQVANLLRLFRIPQVSFFSTSPELSNKMRFEYFTRTIPSDHYQVKAMVDIVRVMGWSYVSIIYEESNYGEKAYEELEKLLGKHQICIAVKEKLSKDSGVAEAHVYDNIVLKLLTKPRARGCIIFASDQEVAGVMKAVRRCNATGAFSWIGSDGWSARSLVSDGNEPEMEGTLSVQPQANPVEGFEDYFLNLTVENNRRNPWFVEFWEDHFKCRYPNASQTPYNNYTEECTTTEKLTRQNTAFEDQLQFVSDAVLAFAYAFREMHKNLCHGNPGLCDAMKPTKGTELLNYLRNVEFKGLSGDVFHFDKNGDGPARYNIIHFKQVSPGKYKWIRVGKYLEGELRLNMSEIQFRLGHPEPPESVCSLPCEVGQAKKYVEGESCCWHCFNCTQYQIRHWTDEKQCVLCPQGTVPDETHSDCRDIPEEFLRPESGWAIGAMSFSSTGILITCFVGGVFLKHNDTPIVRASGRELSYILLTGILLCYLVTFALVLRPNDVVCSIQRFSAGFCFTVVYAALLTKTNRISRIFNAGKRSAKRPSFISPRSQLIICGMLVAVQILINVVWMVIDPAKAMHHYPTREDNLLVCNSYIDASYMIAFTYPIILIVVCTVYAVLTRKIPEAFNESKHIGFTMYTTCVIWLAFVPLYFATGSHVALRITSMSVTISLSASVTIACLFSPKLYIILIHPERNVRPNMMMQNRYNTTKGSVVTATNQSSMLAPVTLTAATCDQNKAVKKHVITTIDCSTQSEQYEMEIKDQKNGKIMPKVMTRETQTLLNNNGKESISVTSPVILEKITDDNIISSKGTSISKITNGPVNQNDVTL